MQIHNIAAKKVIPGDVIVPGEIFRAPHLVREVGWAGDTESLVAITTDEDRYELGSDTQITVWRRSPRSYGQEQLELDLAIMAQQQGR